MTRPAKIVAENRWLELFTKHHRPLDGWKIGRGVAPEPDFIATRDAHSIGIELTELLADRGVRATENEQDGIATAAQRLHEAAGRPAVRVQICWAEAFSPTKRDRGLATVLADLVAARIPPVGSAYILDVSPDAHEEFLHPAFKRISIERTIKYEAEEALWHCLRSWWVEPIGPAIVQKEIDRKKTKPLLYRGNYDESWLILAHHGFQPSSGYELAPEAFVNTYVSGYSRVFLFSLLPLRVISLPLVADRSQLEGQRCAEADGQTT